MSAAQKRSSPSAGDIYRKAAARIEELNGGLTCVKICQAQGREYAPGNPAVVRFRDVFDLDNNEWGDEQVDTNCRILALCFMAAIADSEEAR